MYLRHSRFISAYDVAIEMFGVGDFVGMAGLFSPFCPPLDCAHDTISSSLVSGMGTEIKV